MSDQAWEHLFLLALVAPLVPLLMLTISVWRRSGRRYYISGIALLAFTLLFNPVAQAVIVERWDDDRNYDFARTAANLHLIGKSPIEVQKLLGEPDYVDSWVPTMNNPPELSNRQEGYTCWGYKPFKGYWLGSHFQVFFKHGLKFPQHSRSSFGIRRMHDDRTSRGAWWLRSLKEWVGPQWS